MVIPLKMKMNRCGSRGSSGSDDNILDLLPHDIMVAIMLLLVPPKSLLRLKLVCKSWCALITHPDFIQMHLDHSITNKNPLLLISGKNYALERQVLHSLNFFDYDYDDDDDDGVRPVPMPHSTTDYMSKRYWGSCNGLLCAKILQTRLAVWNPCTHEYLKVSVGGDCTMDVYGFGYDTTTDYYKIIQIKLFYSGVFRRRRLIETQVLVYTLGGLTDSWEPLGTVPFEVSPEHQGLFINGGLHWIATTGCGTIGMIICIDIATEEYREISKPESVSINRDDTMDDNGNVKLISFKRLLCITNYVTNDKSIEVWAMMDYFNEPSSWSKLFTIKEPLMAHPYPGLKYFQLMTGICSKDGDEIVALITDNTTRRTTIVWYNTKDDKTRTILKDHSTGFPVLQAQTCIESLVPLNTGDYNMYSDEEMLEQEREEEERQRILRPWKKQKKNNTCSCISCYNGFSYCYSH